VPRPITPRPESGRPSTGSAAVLGALIRVTRLACAIGIHTGAMTVADGADRFAADTSLAGPAARAEAERAGYDPTYGRYTWGKQEILALRERAREEWGPGLLARALPRGPARSRFAAARPDRRCPRRRWCRRLLTAPAFMR
jgi:hypothetical protein